MRRFLRGVWLLVLLAGCGTTDAAEGDQPSCFDSVQNQGEQGVDCGGPCSPCPSCSDGVVNQGESGVDCGGPCAACETCFDGIQNQGESGVDCGGPCAACPSCFDGIRNQQETAVDCGGPCAPCCADAGTACEDTTECCSDHTCVNFGNNDVVCAYNCATGSECASGCCAPLEGGGSVCAAGYFCGLCPGPGDSCSPGGCCPGYRCAWVDFVGAICVRNTPNPACDSCLAACRGLPSCCTGTGCICEDDCGI